MVDKDLVHKSDERNVFIFDLRRALPMALAEEPYSANAEGLGAADRELLERAYPARADASSGRRFSGMPARLPVETLKRAKAARDEALVAMIEGKYEVVAGEADFLSLREELSESECFSIRNAAPRAAEYFSPEEESRLSGILEAWEGVPREEIFYAEMRVDPSHEYYFEHAIEHVPALMLIEAQRQFGLACCHRYGRIPVKGIQIILKDLSIEFANYAELPFPVTIRGEVESRRWHGKEEYWSELKMAIAFYQWAPVAKFRFTGRSIDVGLFMKMRARKAALLGERRFTPRRPGDFAFCLRESDGSEAPQAALSDLSLGGLRASFSAPFDPRDPERVEFLLHAAGIGFIAGKCRVAWLSEDRLRAGFSITEMTAADTRKLGDFIGTYAIHEADRDRHGGGAAYGN